MLRAYIKRAKRGETVWIGELREAFSRMEESRRMLLRLTDCEGALHNTELWIPRWSDAEERAFVLEYLSAFVFNLLSCFGGRELRFFLPEGDTMLVEMIDELDSVFAVHNEMRGGYGKVISISNRLNAAFGMGSLHFETDDLKNCQIKDNTKESCCADLGKKLFDLSEKARGSFCCGIDVGGTDIKIAVSEDGELLFTKEFDWDPASYTTSREIIEPILLLAQLLRLSSACPQDPRFLACLPKEADLEQIRMTIAALESEYAARLRLFDGIGLSFPDVVIRDRILGGETPKTSGLRCNSHTDYEEEFAKLDGIRTGLQELCSAKGHVRIANDGNIAAFTAAVEMSAKGESLLGGVFAHSLGTDLGTGWLNENGEIPSLPLEMYDFLLDLGCRPQRVFPPEDVRSVRNENSGLPDARKYLGQSAAFRLAAERDTSLVRDYLAQEDGLLRIRNRPEDLRKACLEHLMRRAEEGDKNAVELFRQIGRNLGQISGEIQFLLHPQTDRRYLYGRFVKHPGCFALLWEGFSEIRPELELVAADDDLACSSLMRQLAKSKEATVAQFGQAIGAIYFGLL